MDMKTRINRKASLAFLAIASLSISSYASGDISISPMNENSRAKVEIEVPTREDVHVSVMDPRGIVIHSDVISKNSEYGKMYDFSQVDDGVYTFVTQTGYTTTTKTIELENNSITILNKEYSYDPIFMVEGDLLKVSFLNKSKEKISISLIDTSKDYLREEGDNSLAYGKMIDIKNLPAGEYTFALAAGDRKYFYSFVK
jgi:hypothetical protein